MKIADADILIVPGKGNSGPGHWQRRWSDKMKTARFVDQKDWQKPARGDWVEMLEQAILRATRPVVLVGHSLGVITIAATSEQLTDTKVRGAFLVAPPDVEAETATHVAKAFAPMPQGPLRFPSMLVASANDPHCTSERAAEMANAWGSDFHIAGEAGHINAQSGHGPWPEGLMMFTRLMQRI